MSEHINDLSDGQCNSILYIAGEGFPCMLAADHNGWPHGNSDAKAVWGEKHV